MQQKQSAEMLRRATTPENNGLLFRAKPRAAHRERWTAID